MSSLCPLLTLLLLLLVATPPATSRLLDLSYTYNVDAPTSPALRAFNMTILLKGLQALGFWQVVDIMCMQCVFLEITWQITLTDTNVCPWDALQIFVYIQIQQFIRETL